MARTELGLGSVDNTSDATKDSAATTLTNKTLTSPRINQILDANGAQSVVFPATANAVNYLTIINSAAGGEVVLRAQGADTNLNLVLRPKGTGAVVIRDSSNLQVAQFIGVASAVNRVQIVNAVTGVAPYVTASSANDTNVNLNLRGQGTGVVQANGVDVVTVSGAQTLSNKTIDNTHLTSTTSIPSGATIQQFNSADQTTNYEKLVTEWSANTARIYTTFGGSASVRNLTLGSAAAANSTNISSAFNISGSGAPFFQFKRASATNTPFVDFGGITLSAASGVSTALSVNPVINESGTAGYTVFAVNPTETAIGSGAKLLADFQVGGVSKARIDTTGSHVLSSGAATIVYATADETTNYERVRQYWNGNTYTITTENGGTGSLRAISINGASSFINLTASGLNMGRNSTSNQNIITQTATLIASSGIQNLANIVPTINQTGSAGYTALLVNVTETATGSGAKNLLDLQVGGASKVSVTNLGQLKLTTSTTGAATLNIPTGVAPLSPSVGDIYSDGTHVYCYLASTWKQLD